MSVEDPLDEDDWPGFVDLTARIGDKVQVVGDDLFVTNPERLGKGIEMKAGQRHSGEGQSDWHPQRDNESHFRCQAGWFWVIISHRSGETEDKFYRRSVCGDKCRTD